jgi:hypothetical protein
VSTAPAHRATSPPRPTRHGDLLKVSAYDRAASLLVALLVMVGLTVGMLTVIWITTRVFTRPAAPEMFLVEEEPGADMPDGPSINEPGLEELDLAQPDVQDTLAAVTDAVSTIAASLDAIETAVSNRGSGGDNRKRGGGDHLPRWQRWEIRYLNTTLEAYAKQLEFFGIELAAMGGGRATVDYAAFPSGRPTARTLPPGEDDDRLYFIWQGGRFRDQDRSLLTKAGVDTSGRIICQFYPPAIENQLAVLEEQARGTRPLRDIRRTIFGVRAAGRSYEFYVVELQWRS